MATWHRLHRHTLSWWRRVREQDGVVLVEFAIVLPILVLIILGILYFGRYEGDNNQVTQLAEQAVRAASVDSWPGSPATSLQTYIRGQATGDLSTSGSSPVKVWVYLPTGSTYSTGAQGQSPGTIRACVTAKATAMPWGGSGPTLSGVATMRLETVAPSSSYTGATPFASSNPTGTMPSQCPS